MEINSGSTNWRQPPSRTPLPWTLLLLPRPVERVRLVFAVLTDYRTTPARTGSTRQSNLIELTFGESGRRVWCSTAAPLVGVG
jgi:hypothetical protein